MGSLPPLDPAMLGFDACERLTLMTRAVRAVAGGAGGAVLDVGGHPGYLARLLDGITVVTADTITPGPEPFVRASGARLPFADAAFDVVAASDTLEHVPAAARAGFLQELRRVARRCVLLGGPFNTPGVAAAEASLRSILGEGSARGRWLAEHAQHGLPDLAATAAALGGPQATCAAVPSGDLLTWFAMMAADAVLGATAPDAWKKFGTAWNAAGSAPVPAVAYRHLLIAMKEGAAMPSLAGAVSVESAVAGAGAEVVRAVEERIGALADLMEGLHRRTGAQHGRAGGVDAAYVDQLERALAQQRDVIARLSESRGDGGAARPVKSLLRRVLGEPK